MAGTLPYLEATLQEVGEWAPVRFLLYSGFMISKEEVEGLAELARLKLTPEDTAELQKDISNILDYISQVTSIPAGEGEATPLKNVMREDMPRGEDTLTSKQEALLEALPAREGDFVVVRKIIQKDE